MPPVYQSFFHTYQQASLNKFNQACSATLKTRVYETAIHPCVFLVNTRKENNNNYDDPVSIFQK